MSIFKAGHCLGLHISRYRVVGVLAEQGNIASKPVNLYVAESDQDMSLATNYPVLADCLGQVLDQFGKDFSGRYIPLQISLADPLLKTAVFDLDVVPRQAKAREQLVRWRFDRECHVDTTHMSIAYQCMEDKQGRQQIFALAGNSGFIDVIVDTCHKRDLMLQHMDAAGNYLFNNYYETMVESASLLQLNHDYWSLMAWDGDRRIRYMRSKWYSSSEMKRTQELTQILLDVERLLHTFIGNGGDALSMLYIEPADHDREPLENALMERMGNNFSFLQSDNNAGNSGLYELAALAARCR